jgi:hypothetical protein
MFILMDEYKLQAGFQVLKVIVKMAVFWVIAWYSFVELYLRFRGTCCLHHQGTLVIKAVSISEKLVGCTRLHGTTTQKTAIFSLAAMRTSNLTSVKSSLCSDRSKALDTSQDPANR